MLLWKKKEQRCIRNRLSDFLKRKEEGGAQVFIIALFMIMFLAVLLKVTFDQQRVYITYDTVDDSIVSALVGSSTYNVDEMAYSGNIVIFRTLTEFEPEEVPIPGETPPPEPTEEELEEMRALAMDEFLNNSELFNPLDPYLDKARADFVRILKRNLKLDDSFNCRLSGVEGTVTIEEFAIYNKYEWLDENGVCQGYRIIKYSHNGSAWNVYPYNINTPVTVYSSYDHADIPVEHTTVSAKLAFNLRLSDYSSDYFRDLTESDMLMGVSYQRAVDIKK